MAVSIVIDITQNSQDIANNTSNVTVKVNAKWTGGSYNLLEKSGSCTIDGKEYTFTSHLIQEEQQAVVVICIQKR